MAEPEQHVTKVMKKLIQLRHEQGLSAVEVAKVMGVTRQQVWNIETGYQGDPSILTVERYAKAIGAKLVVVERSP